MQTINLDFKSPAMRNLSITVIANLIHLAENTTEYTELHVLKGVRYIAWQFLDSRPVIDGLHDITMAELDVLFIIDDTTDRELFAN
jgi:hypothetical protein